MRQNSSSSSSSSNLRQQSLQTVGSSSKRSPNQNQDEPVAASFLANGVKLVCVWPAARMVVVYSPEEYQNTSQKSESKDVV